MRPPSPPGVVPPASFTASEALAVGYRNSGRNSVLVRPRKHLAAGGYQGPWSEPKKEDDRRRASDGCGARCSMSAPTRLNLGHESQVLEAETSRRGFESRS
jgi:hypothetical protein